MALKYTAADLLAIANGRHSLRRERPVLTAPRPLATPKPATMIAVDGLPQPRRRSVTAADILVISRYTQPWHALVASKKRLATAG